MNLEGSLNEYASTTHSFHQLDQLISTHFPQSSLFPTHAEIGQLLPLSAILLDDKKVMLLIKQIIHQHWQAFNLFSAQDLQQINLEMNHIQSRIEQFFEQPSNMDRVMQYLKKNNCLTYSQFLSIVFEKELIIKREYTDLKEIVLFSVKNKYILQPLYKNNVKFYRLLLVKKMCSALMQSPLEDIHHLTQFMKQYKHYLSYEFTNNRIAMIIHQHVLQLDYENKKSFELKQLHLFNIVNHYVSGRRSLKRLHKCIDYFSSQFKSGNFTITYKEETLFYYLLFMRSIALKIEDENVNYARALIENERINEHAVEIFFEFGDALKVARPIPESIIKLYPNYYMEHVFYLIVQTFVEQHLFEECFEVLKQFELATCTAIYNVLNGDVSEEGLAKIEATVQRDIAHTVQLPPQKMMEAIQIWLTTYSSPSVSYYETAHYSVKHIINILKTLFVMEQFDAFEKIFEVYKKYLEVPHYTEQLHVFLLQYVDEKSSHLALK